MNGPFSHKLRLPADPWGAGATIVIRAVLHSLLCRFRSWPPVYVALVSTVMLVACAPPPEIVIVTPPPAGRGGSAAGASGQPAKVMYQMDAQHTGRSSFAGPRQAILLRSFDTTTVETPDPGDPQPDIQSSTAIGADGTIYIGNLTGNLFALRDPGSGSSLEMAWRFHPSGASPYATTPAIGRDGTVYVGFSQGGDSADARGTFYALRAPVSGREPDIVWSVDFGAGSGRQSSSPTIGPDGTVYVPSGVGRLFAIGADGSVKWTVSTGPSLKAAPAIAADGTVYVSSMDGKLYAVSPPSGAATEGTVKWTFDFGENLGPTPIVTAPTPPPGVDGIGSAASPTIGSDGTIYVGANNSNFYAITPTGAMRWLFEAQREVGGIWSSAVLSQDANTLYFGANRGGVYALNAANGSLRWRFDIFGSIYTSPVLDSRGTLYTGSTVGLLFALDAATGQRVFDYDAGSSIWTAPSIRADGSLVTGDTRGRVLLLGAP
jgi:outer membrane protein assembly factor BamB